MTSTATQYRTVLQPLTTVIEAVAPGGWEAPSPCEGWAARDVLEHVVHTQRDLLATHGVDLGPAPDTRADPAAAWRQHTSQVLAALGDDELVDRAYDGYFGPTTVGRTVEDFYVWDMVVHRWDLARAAGRPADLTVDELERIERGADAFGESLYLDGICRPAVDVPPDADRTTRVLARLGRVA